MPDSYAAIGVASSLASSGLRLQTVNNRHSRLKDFLRARRGIATRYLDSYLRWFHLIVLHPDPTPRYCLAAAVGAISVNTNCE